MANNYSPYVKFVRGTPEQFEMLNPKNKDTLYFIAQTDATEGILYLGDKKICCGLDSMKIEQIVNLAVENKKDGDVLVYDGASEKWVNKNLFALMDILIPEFQGATEDNNGSSGLVPQPKKGEQNYFLRGDGKWSPVAAANQDGLDDILNQIQDLTNQMNNFAISSETLNVQKQVNGYLIDATWTLF